MNKDNFLIAFVGILLILAVVFTPRLLPPPTVSYGSVNQGNEYYATTTDATWSGTTFASAKVINTGVGALGSVIIEKATAAGTINIYDATTTNVNLRTNNLATTTITLASFLSTALGGTYTFDATYLNGLIIEVGTSAGVASSTITYR